MPNIALILLIFIACPAFGKTLQDHRGTAVDVTAEPERIVSTFLGADEMLLEVLTRAGKRHHLVALSSLADNRAYSHIAPVPEAIKVRVGDNVEQLVKLQPDLAIVASYNRPELVRRLEQVKVRTFVMGQFASFADIKNNLRTIGDLTHSQESALGVIKDFEAILSKTQNPPQGQARKTLLTFMTNGTVHGKGTTFDDIATYSGCTNLASQQGLSGWAKVSPEKLAMMNPDYLVAMGDPTNKSQILEQIRKTVGFQNMPAAKAGRLILVPGKDLTTVSHHVHKATTHIHKAVYP